MMLPLPIIAWLAGGAILEFWLHAGDFDRMAHIAAILASALLLNAVAHVPQAYVQATGRASWTGKLHLIELLLWMLYLPKLVMEYGPEGAAYGWLVRVIISTLILFAMASRVMKAMDQEGEK
jgi:O-antigen/teichoic acid export membrane protein